VRDGLALIRCGAVELALARCRVAQQRQAEAGPACLPVIIDRAAARQRARQPQSVACGQLQLPRTDFVPLHIGDAVRTLSSAFGNQRSWDRNVPSSAPQVRRQGGRGRAQASTGSRLLSRRDAPDTAPMRVLAVPVKMTATSGDVRRRNPLLGTPPNKEVGKYPNAQKVPQVLAAIGSQLLDDTKNLPWSTIFSMPQRIESQILVQYILDSKPNAKIGILHQNEEYGKGHLKLLKDALDDRAASLIVKEAGYDLTDPTIDSRIVTLHENRARTRC
jgi:hypothetical protein